jgi:hypothetical protein
MSDIESLSSAAASNSAPAPNGAPEGMAPSGVNDTMREMMGAMHRDWERRGPTVTSGGSANTQTLTYGAAPTAYVQGQAFSFIAGFTNAGATTLNVNGLGPKAVRLGNAALSGGEIQSGAVYTVMYDGANFQIVSVPGLGRGLLVGVQYFTAAGSSTYTPTPGTSFVVVEVQGAGGGGGGCATTGAGQVAHGGNGGGGGYARKRITAAFGGVTITVGAKGTAGSAGNNAGGSGGTSSFGALVSASGGGPGLGGVAGGVPSVSTPGGGGNGSGGDINVGGGAGDYMINTNTAVAMSGKGGSAFYSPAALSTLANGGGAAGNIGPSAGGGGTGGVNTASQGTGRAGATGADGMVIIWEFQ